MLHMTQLASLRTVPIFDLCPRHDKDRKYQIEQNSVFGNLLLLYDKATVSTGLARTLVGIGGGSPYRGSSPIALSHNQSFIRFPKHRTELIKKNVKSPMIPNRLCTMDFAQYSTILKQISPNLVARDGPR